MDMFVLVGTKVIIQYTHVSVESLGTRLHTCIHSNLCMCMFDARLKCNSLHCYLSHSPSNHHQYYIHAAIKAHHYAMQLPLVVL